MTVVPGGVNGPVTARKITLTQNSPGVPGSSESGDGFGAATAWGDVNGDGYADLAIGSPGEDDTSGHADRGSVTVMYGPALDTGFSYTTSGSVTATGAKLGSTVAVGDFNGDGKADVFSAGDGQGGSWNVRLTGGATTSGTLTTATGSVAYLDAATGDFNRDGYTDVALNYRDAGGVSRVVRFAGSASGPAKQGVLSVKGGRSIAAADFTLDGYDDIVIGQPYTSESGAYKGGQVTMLLGASTGFTTTGMKTIDQDTSGVPGAAEDGDAMGWSVSMRRLQRRRLPRRAGRRAERGHHPRRREPRQRLPGAPPQGQRDRDHRHRRDRDLAGHLGRPRLHRERRPARYGGVADRRVRVRPGRPDVRRGR